MTDTVFLVGSSQRTYAKSLIDKAGTDMVMTLRKTTRTIEQNAKCWAMLADVARAKPQGHVWTPETWKSAFMHLLGHQVRFCPGLDDSGPFPMGFRSSHLNTKQMSDLIEVIYAYGAEHGVQWSEPAKKEMAA